MADTWTVRRILEWTSGFFKRKEVDAPRLSAELLLSHVLNYPRIKLYTDYERPLTDAELSTMRGLIARGAEHEPIAYLTGKAPFFSLEFEVTRDVLIPRADTETLVENVLQTARHQVGLEAPRVLDLCTGSGCIAAAIAKNLKNSTVLATDISAAAVVVAQRNVARLGLTDRVAIEHGDLFEPLRRRTEALAPYNLIVSNPPYIPTGQVAGLDRNVREFEPLVALDGGPDGLALHRRILAESRERLLPGGRIYLEIASDQGALAMKIARDHESSFDEIRVLTDHAARDRVLTARRREK